MFAPSSVFQPATTFVRGPSFVSSHGAQLVGPAGAQTIHLNRYNTPGRLAPMIVRAPVRFCEQPQMVMHPGFASSCSAAPFVAAPYMHSSYAAAPFVAAPYMHLSYAATPFLSVPVLAPDQVVEDGTDECNAAANVEANDVEPAAADSENGSAQPEENNQVDEKDTVQCDAAAIVEANDAEPAAADA